MTKVKAGETFVYIFDEVGEEGLIVQALDDREDMEQPLEVRITKSWGREASRFANAANRKSIYFSISDLYPLTTH